MKEHTYNRLFQLKNENPILSKIEVEERNMCQRPTNRVNVSRKGFCVRQNLANFLRHLLLSEVTEGITFDLYQFFIVPKYYDFHVVSCSYHQK